MKKLIVFLIILILTLSTVNAVHCFIYDSSQNTFSFNSLTGMQWVGLTPLPTNQEFMVDGQTITDVMMINGSVHPKFSGHYNFLCNNGWVTQSKPFVDFSINNTTATIQNQTNCFIESTPINFSQLYNNQNLTFKNYNNTTYINFDNAQSIQPYAGNYNRASPMGGNGQFVYSQNINKSTANAINLGEKIYNNRYKKLTISLWIKPHNLISNNSKEKFGIFGYSNKFELYFKPNTGRLVGDIGNQDNSHTVTSQRFQWIGNGWYHVALTYDPNGKTELWIDGVKQASSNSNPLDSSSNTNFYIGSTGRNNNSSDPFPGVIDDFIYFEDEVLEDCEIKQLAKGTKACLPPCETSSIPTSPQSNSGGFFCTNVIDCNAPIVTLSLPYCETNDAGAIVDGSYYVGGGNLDTIFRKKVFGAEDLGVYSYILRRDNKAMPGNMVMQSPITMKSGAFFVAGYPSLLVFGPENITTGFYENGGNYEKDLIFTLRREHVLDIKIMDYNIECSTGVQCSIDKNKINYTLTKDNKTIMLFGKITIPKNIIPKNVFTRLNVKYQMTALSTLSPYNLGHWTSSNPMTQIDLGFLDKQDFQIRTVAGKDLYNCAGADGTVGQTGPDFSPRINLKMGGNEDDSVVDINDCDKSNDNWVYCTQSEFLVSLARRIDKIAQLRKQIVLVNSSGVSDKEAQISLLENQINELNQFTAAVRTLNVSNNSLIGSINYINEQSSEFLGKTGLGTDNIGNVGSNFSPNYQTNTSKLTGLFTGTNNVNKVIFEEDGQTRTIDTFQAGEYTVKINVFSPIEEDYDLFTSTNTLNPNLEITIDLGKWNRPYFDWFFYNEGFEEAFPQGSNITAPELVNSNVLKRGTIFEFDQNTTLNSLQGQTIWRSFAVPLFIKINKDNNVVNNSFTISDSPEELTELINTTGKAFTYWTGFASNKGSGCEDINPSAEQGILAYNLTDYIEGDNGTDPTQNVILREYSNIANNDIEYLQTVLYLPYRGAQTDNLTELTLSGNIKMFSPGKAACTTANCELVFKPDDTEFKFNNLQEVFDKITDGDVCVSQERQGQNVNWKLFWNEQEILRTMNSLKETIISQDEGVQICSGRVINSN